MKNFALALCLPAAGAFAGEAGGAGAVTGFALVILVQIVVAVILMLAVRSVKNAVLKLIEEKFGDLHEHMNRRGEEVKTLLDKVPETPAKPQAEPEVLDDRAAIGRLDERFWEVAFWAAERGRISVREVQSSFEMRAVRASEVVSQMEMLGICAEPDGDTGTCQVLLGSDEVKNLIKRFVGIK